jgi:hypothetical protein
MPDSPHLSLLRRIVDSWTFRRWVFLVPCALRGHPGTFRLQHNLNGDPWFQTVKCSCGRRTHKEGG